jgi:hypothetical protein
LPRARWLFSSVTLPSRYPVAFAEWQQRPLIDKLIDHAAALLRLQV